MKMTRAGTANYNDHKSGLVYDIYERIFSADTEDQHEPRPRDRG